MRQRVSPAPLFCLAPRLFGRLWPLPVLWGRPGGFFPSALHRGPRRRRGGVRGGLVVLGAAPRFSQSFSPGRLRGRPRRGPGGPGAARLAGWAPPPPPRRSPGCPANFVPGGVRGRAVGPPGSGGAPPTGAGAAVGLAAPSAASQRGQSPPGWPAPLCALSAAGDC